jgi:hypothetical protein
MSLSVSLYKCGTFGAKATTFAHIICCLLYRRTTERSSLAVRSNGSGPHTSTSEFNVRQLLYQERR